MSLGGTTGYLLVASVIAATPALAQQSPAWIAEGPSVRIGSLDGGDPYLFESARTGLLLSDGSVLVADRNEFRIFNAAGVHARTIGRAGEGPGEFKSIAWVRATDSGLRAYDWLQRRISEFSLDGQLLSTSAVSYPDHDGSLSLIWSDDKGNQAYVVTRNTPRMSEGDRDDYSVSATGSSILLSGAGDLAEHLAGSYERKYIARVGSSAYLGSEPLTSVLETASGSSFVAAIPRDSDTLRVLYPGGQSLEIALEVSARDLRASERRAFRNHFVDGATTAGRAAERQLVLERMEWPSEAPRVDKLLVDSDDRAWTRLFDLEGESTRWLLVDPISGTHRRVSLPPDRELLDARGERVLLRSVDELGVPHVEVWSIAPAE